MSTNNNNNSLDNFAAPNAYTLADAQSLNYPIGGQYRQVDATE